MLLRFFISSKALTFLLRSSDHFVNKTIKALMKTSFFSFFVHGVKNTS